MPWVIQVMRKLSGEEYPTIIEKELLNKQQQTQRLPIWRLVTVPPEYAHLDPISILHACYTARIDWRKVEKNERVTKRPGPGTDPRPGD